MSGFEIVGVVLGALPIVIEGLEQYRKGLNNIMAMKNYEETIENLLITFESTRARYIFQCETLLAPLMLPQGQYTALVNSPNLKIWSDPTLRDTLADRLGPANDPYLGLVQRLHRHRYTLTVYQIFTSYVRAHKIKTVRALLKFAGKMEIEIQQNMKSRLPAPSSSGQNKSLKQGVSQISTQSSRIWARIRIGLENGGLERLLDTMEKDLFRIERLLETSAKLPAIRKDRKPLSLFTAFNKRWTCPCHSGHSALLRLDVIDPSRQHQTGACFDILLSKPNAGFNRGLAQATWHNFRVDSAEDPTKLPGFAPNNSNSHTHTTTLTFQIASAEDIGFGPELHPPTTISVPGTLIKIDDLCSALQTKKLPKCLGHLDDGSWRHTISCAQDPNVPANAGIVKIYDLLDGAGKLPKVSSSSLTMSTRQKYHLALSMSFAVLQLFDTPWLSSHESFRDIHLVTALNNSAQPYMMKQFHSPAPSTTPTNQMHRIGIQNQLLFHLGVLLLEIAYGQPLSQFRQPSDLDANGNETIFTDYLVAVRLADEITQREPSKYSDAVRRCLFCRFPCTSTDLSSVELQEEFHGGVVVPLLEIYSVFT